MKPKDVKTNKQLCALPRDNWSVRDFCIGFNSVDELYFHEQKVSEPVEQEFVIPLKVFDALVKKLGYK